MAQVSGLFRCAGLCGVLLLSHAAIADAQSPNVGDLAPEFRCLDAKNKTWDSREHVGKKTVVVYFYPSDFAFCCTRQARRYEERLCELTGAGAEVVGISGDAVASHQLFSSSQNLNFSLLSDGQGDVTRQFGVPVRAGGKAMASDAAGDAVVDESGKVISFARNVTTARWTFIIDTDGRIIYRETNVSPIGDTQRVLEFLRERAARIPSSDAMVADASSPENQ